VRRPARRRRRRWRSGERRTGRGARVFGRFWGIEGGCFSEISHKRYQEEAQWASWRVGPPGSGGGRGTASTRGARSHARTWARWLGRGAELGWGARQAALGTRGAGRRGRRTLGRLALRPRDGRGRELGHARAGPRKGSGAGPSGGREGKKGDGVGRPTGRGKGES
jgi:hypothetical protein